MGNSRRGPCARVAALFAEYDTNSDGVINLEELGALLKSLEPNNVPGDPDFSESDVKLALEVLDANGSGEGVVHHVTYMTFVTSITPITPIPSFVHSCFFALMLLSGRMRFRIVYMWCTTRLIAGLGLGFRV